MAGEQKYTVDIGVTGLQSLDKLQTSIDGVQKRMLGLKTVLTGVLLGGGGAFARGAVAMADSIQDISNATGIASDRILAFQTAVKAGGGSVENASKALFTFYASIQSAVDGSIAAQSAFDALGISLTDINNLSEQELFVKALERLSLMEPSAKKAALQMELLGKAGRSLSIDPAFINTLSAGSEQAKTTAASIAQAAKLNDEWAASTDKLRLSFIEAFGPLISSLNQLLGVLPSLTQAFRVLGVVIATALAITGARALIGALGMVARGFGVITALGSKFGNIFKGIGNGANTINSPLGKLRDVASAVIAPIAAAATAWGLWSNSTDTATTATDTNTSATDLNTQAQRNAKSAIDDKVKSIQAQVTEFSRVNAQTLEQINLDAQLIGTSRQYQDTQKAQAALAKRSADEIDKLTKAKEALSEKEKQLGLGTVYDQQIAEIQRLTQVEQERVNQAIANASSLQNLEERRLFGIRSEYDLQDKLLNIQRDIADVGLTDIEKKYRDIVRAADDSAKAAIRAEEARRGAPLNTQEIQDYYAKARQGTDRLVTSQKKLYDSSRTFSTGWNKAFKEYVDNATNAAAKAERMFAKFTSGLEDLIVEFAKTGKFEWQGFVNSMLEELLRSQIRETLSSLGTAFGFGNLFGGGGSANARGTTANNPMYVIDVGSGSGGGSNLIGSLMGNNSMASGGGIGGGGGGGGIFDTIGSIFSGVTSTVGSVFDSIGSGISSLFDGFFAGGGQIGAGRFGMVGESGPELISGPANITPLSGLGGGTSVTYNINAVDARSFQSLLAQDPGFVHAVVQQGARGIPQRR